MHAHRLSVLAAAAAGTIICLAGCGSSTTTPSNGPTSNTGTSPSNAGATSPSSGSLAEACPPSTAISADAGTDLPAPTSTGSASSGGVTCDYGTSATPLVIKYISNADVSSASGLQPFIAGLSTNAKLTAVAGLGEAAYSYAIGTSYTVAVLDDNTVIVVTGPQSYPHLENVARVVIGE